jgi:hypothetical protein
MVDESEENPRDRHIVSISPALDGWRAVLVDPHDEHKCFAFPVICWALCRKPYVDEGTNERGVETYVAPVIAEVRANHPNGTVIASDFASFVGIAAPGETPEEILSRHRDVELHEILASTPSAGDA